ncbi:hypothetical protein BDZ45DRAFT_808113 [Acephala macrosclerotiorum]|nr:hypothetical protein BDZ45DRAFT_808113 [Acephala macrosclerotiorum]
MTTSELYPYTPNQNATLAATALFGLSAFIHLIIIIMKRTWFYTAMTIGSFSKAYLPHTLIPLPQDSIPLYAMQSLLILLPPSLYAATIYMIYGRIVLFVNAPDASIIRPTREGWHEASASSADLGQKLMLVGLVVQLIFFGFFLTVTITFDRRMSKSPLRYPKIRKTHMEEPIIAFARSSVCYYCEVCVYGYRVFEWKGGVFDDA